MQKLYRSAFQKILTKISVDKLNTLTVSSLETLLKEKGIPLQEIDETLFHKLPRQEVKNLVRNPCPINNSSQTTTEIVTNAKAIRGSLNIVEKKICFRCPFVASCDKAFMQPATDFKISNPLENLLISMNKMSEIQENEKIRNRSWFSGVRVCDSLNSVIDDLLQGGEEFKVFKSQRNLWKEEVEAEKQKQEVDEKQILKAAKKNNVPLKDVYAQIPTSEKVQKQGRVRGEQMFQELSKGPENIFKKKKGDEFIKIAQKYLNEEETQKPKEKRSDKKQKKQSQQKRQYEEEEGDEPKKPQKRQYQEQRKQKDDRKYRDQRQSRDEPKQNFKNMRKINQREDNQRQEREFDRKERSTQRRQTFRHSAESQSDYERSSKPKNKYQNDKYNRGEKQGSQRRKYFRNQDEENPKIRRFSKEKPKQNAGQRNNYEGETKFSKQSNRLDKFYSEMREERNEQDEILSQLNRKEYKPRESNLPRDAKFNSEEGGKKEKKPKDFSQKQMEQFNRLEKIPKILKTQFASKQDILDRVQQEKEVSQVSTERKGRRVKRQ